MPTEDQAPPPRHPAALAFEQNQFEFLRRIRQGWPDAIGRFDGGIQWCVTREPLPPVNSIFAIDLDAGALPAALAEPLRVATERRVPMMAWVTPGSRPTGLPSRLASAGFVPIATYPVMISETTRPAAIGRPDVAAVQSAADAASLRTWMDVQIQTMGLNPSTAEAMLGRYLAVGAGPGQAIECFTAFADGAPVASGLVFVAAGVAGIYNVCTAPQARRKGHAARVTQACVDAARARGIDHVALVATGLGEPLYRSLGFTPVESYDLLRWAPPTGS